MAKNLGTAWIQIKPSMSGVTSDIRNELSGAQGAIDKEGETAGKSWGKQFAEGAVGAVIVSKAFSKITSVMTGAINTGKEFGSSMSQVAATLGYSVDELHDSSSSAAQNMEKLTGFAKEMGASTVFSATESAQALNYMALAGYDAETSMKMLPNVLNLAAAGGIELATASDMITDAQTALGLTIDDTTALVDQMAKTASKTNTSVGQLGEAILTVGGTASYMAGGTEELNAVLGVMANSGIKGAEAGTHLRNMLLRMAAPTAEGSKLLEDLGVSIFDAEGNMRSFSQIFPELNSAMSSLTDEQKLDAFSTLFNTRDISSVNALLSTSSDEWAELGATILDSAGAAEQMAGVQLDNLSGDTTKLNSAWEGLQITIAEKFEPVLRSITQALTEMIGFIADNWDWLQPIFLTVIGFLTTVIGIVSAKKIYNSIKDVFSLISGGFSKSVGKVTNIFGKGAENKIIGNVKSLGTRIADTIKSFAAPIKQAFASLGEILTTVVNAVMEPLKAVFKGIGEALAGFFTALANPAIALGAAMFALAAASIAAAIFLIGSAIGAVMPVIQALFDGVIMPIAQFIADTVLALIDAITQAIVTLTNDAIIPLGEFLVGSFVTILQTVSDIIIQLTQSAVIPLIETLSGAFTTVLKTVGDIINNVVGTALKGIAEIVKAVGDGFLKMGEAIKLALDGVSGVINAFADLIKAIAAAAVAIVALVTGHSIDYGNGYAHLDGYAMGGRVFGEGSATSDSIPAMLSNGEYVIRASAAQQIGYDNLDTMNETGQLSGGQTNYFTINGYNKSPEELANIISRKIAFNQRGVIG